jgi:DUF4097 and DUF4098 domain-containing protein YvlB
MPTFDTPEPILATVELESGSLRIYAGDRAETVVQVRPSDPTDDGDIQTAEHTQVEFANGNLLVKAPRNTARWWLFQWTGSVDITIDLPTDSRVTAAAALADVRCEGRLGESRISTSAGDIQLDQVGKLRVDSGDGDISVARSAGHLEATTSNGEIRVREVDGSAMARTANGGITIGEVRGDARLNTAHGEIAVDRALASVAAKTAAGDIRIREVVRGSVALETGAGELEVGIRAGTAALLDVSTLLGTVRSSLEPSDGPGPDDETVEVRARATAGDIVIHRS